MYIHGVIHCIVIRNETFYNRLPVMAFSKPPLNCRVVLHDHGGVDCGYCY